MSQLIVRNLEPSLVQKLKERSARNGRSCEAEHREILRLALTQPTRGSLKDLLASMPEEAKDEDFARPRRPSRKVAL
jgi:plasmid stability protein